MLHRILILQYKYHHVSELPTPDVVTFRLHCLQVILLSLQFVTSHSSFIAVLMDSDVIFLIIALVYMLTVVQWYEYYSDAKVSHNFQSHTGLH